MGDLALMLAMWMSFSPTANALRALPGTYRVSVGQWYHLDTGVAVISSRDETQQVQNGSISARETGKAQVSVDLFGLIPLRRIRLQVGRETRLMPGGSAVGVALATRGVLVVGVSDVAGQSPAQQAGLRAGDVIEAVDGSELSDSSHLTRLVAASGGKPLAVSFRRNGLLRSVRLSPLLDRSSGQWRISAWVRDSTAGVGTLSDDSTRLYFQAVFRSSRENAGGAAPDPAGEEAPPRAPPLADGVRFISQAMLRRGKENENMPLPGRPALPAGLCASAQGKTAGISGKTNELVFQKSPLFSYCPGALLPT